MSPDQIGTRWPLAVFALPHQPPGEDHHKHLLWKNQARVFAPVAAGPGRWGA